MLLCDLFLQKLGETVSNFNWPADLRVYSALYFCDLKMTSQKNTREHLLSLQINPEKVMNVQFSDE